MSNLKTPLSKWLSVDPAKSLGVATWYGNKLVHTSTIRPSTKTEIKNAVKQGHIFSKDPYSVVQKIVGAERSEPKPFFNLHAAYCSVVDEAEFILVEHSMGHIAKAVSQVAWRRGYFACLAALVDAVFVEVNTSEWRRVASETWDVSFPNDSALCKALALKLCAENYTDVEGYDDEADAVLIGHWGLRTRTIDP